MLLRFIFLFSFLAILLIKGNSQDAGEIIKRSEDKMRGTTLQAEMTLRTVRPNWTREMDMKVWTKGNDYSLIQITAPAKEKGIAYLKRKKEVWNWIPSLERTIKLPPSMMSQSWMGTDFTNDDLVKESSTVNDYKHLLLGEEILDGRLCYKIKLIPKPETAVVWGKIIICVDKQDHLQLRSEFFDEDSSLVSTLTGKDIKMMGGRMIPTVFEMVPANKKGQKTVIIYKSLLFNQPIKDDFFSPQNMKKTTN